MSNFIKIRLVRPEIFHADEQTDGRTDVTKLIDAFHNFANACENFNNALFNALFLCNLRTS